MIVVALTAIGILMVYSSSAMKAYIATDDTLSIVGPQIGWAALGMLAMAGMMRVDYRYLRFVSVPVYAFALAPARPRLRPEPERRRRRLGPLAEAAAPAGPPPGRVREARA